MERIYEFLKEAGTYYLATLDGAQPRVRPFGTIDIFDGRLTIQTGLSKDCARQMRENPRVELCAFHNGRWLRVAATVRLDERIEAQEHMLDAYPSLRGMYTPGDGNTAVFALTDVTATFSSFGAPPEVVHC